MRLHRHRRPGARAVSSTPADVGWTLAALLAFGFALDALYGLMAPERQRRRDQRLGDLMRRRRA